ncbi:MAG: hypothetical protein J6X97_01935 [Lachnospiraceae bacterium]|nr:hypothetical protein [Lachnospiraceae bacterium]
MAKEIEVDNILNEVREDIKDKNLTEEKFVFKDVQISDSMFDSDHEFSMDEYMDTVKNINQLWKIPMSVHIQGRGKLIKKLVERLTYFSIIPRFSSQNDFNKSVTKGFNEMAAYIVKQNETIDSLNEKVERLEKELKEEKDKK